MEALKDIVMNHDIKDVSIKKIKDAISSMFGISIEDIDSKKRTRSIAYPRQIAMYLSRELTDLSLPKIGQEFGGRDHTTVLHAYDKISLAIKNNEDTKKIVDKLLSKLN